MSLRRACIASAICALAVSIAAGCSATGDASGVGASLGAGGGASSSSATSSSSTGTSGVGGSPLMLTGSDAGTDASADGSTADCPASAKLIYVTGSSNQLYSYDPTTGVFTLIGTFDCLTNPTHMTVDRSGTAWVVSNGLLYTASTVNAHCNLVSNWTPGVNEFFDFALTFVGTGPGTDPNLYVLDDSGNLAAFNPTTGVRTAITTLAGLTSSLGDMTSNGDGHLYFVHDVAAQRLYEIVPTTGAVVNSWLTTEVGGNSEALAFYGGLFYDFLGSAAYTFDTSTSTAQSVGNAPLEVTGAGQSTCVPMTAPPPAMLQ